MGSTSLRAEVERQLSDTNFYQQQDHDFSIDNDNTVRRVVKEATSQHGTTRLCYQHLIVDSPCTFKLFRPKPTNPENLKGLSTISACNCPTKLIAPYLDATTTALVISLPSFVKDTEHMLYITESVFFFW